MEKEMGIIGTLMYTGTVGRTKRFPVSATLRDLMAWACENRHLSIGKFCGDLRVTIDEGGEKECGCDEVRADTIPVGKSFISDVNHVVWTRIENNYKGRAWFVSHEKENKPVVMSFSPEFTVILLHEDGE